MSIVTAKNYSATAIRVEGPNGFVSTFESGEEKRIPHYAALACSGAGMAVKGFDFAAAEDGDVEPASEAEKKTTKKAAAEKEAETLEVNADKTTKKEAETLEVNADKTAK